MASRFARSFNSHWDEWVAESRVLRKDPTSLQLQKDRVREFHRAHKRQARPDAQAIAKRAKPSETGKADEGLLQVRAGPRRRDRSAPAAAGSVDSL